jgi:hypothetical protein
MTKNIRDSLEVQPKNHKSSTKVVAGIALNNQGEFVLEARQLSWVLGFHLNPLRLKDLSFSMGSSMGWLPFKIFLYQSYFSDQRRKFTYREIKPL